ncbi:MAG TPA: hypothetical protein VKP11_02750, partial [Frankiaceae bacterium]|nr:hypothetical protein [Frankiaceae bacterium]
MTVSAGRLGDLAGDEQQVDVAGVLDEHRLSGAVVQRPNFRAWRRQEVERCSRRTASARPGRDPGGPR